jgi:hypothetical protein
MSKCLFDKLLRKELPLRHFESAVKETHRAAAYSQRWGRRPINEHKSALEGTKHTLKSTPQANDKKFATVDAAGETRTCG